MATRPAAAPKADTLLVELLTEELPPKALEALARAFRDRLTNDLEAAGLRATGSTARYFATPRRLAVSITRVLAVAPDAREKVQGPSVKAPAEAAAGFARKHGVEVDALVRHETSKGFVYLVERIVPGAKLAEVLAQKVEAALAALPVPKMMRWGAGEAQFVRPAHALVMLHGAKIIPGTVLGLAAGRRTRGHRFLSKGWISLRDAESYEAQLRDEGAVIADFEARRAGIERQLQAEAAAQRSTLGEYADLLAEVAALVEQPSVYLGAFDKSFLAIPPECLALTLRQNQKYFPLFDARGALLPKFLIVSNMTVADPRKIVAGNERVVRPRLEDARFFYDQDRKLRLEERVPQLGRVVFHHKLGSLLDRVQRVKILAGIIANELGVDRLLAERAAELSKADLLTGMVGEFPELQGVMGRYYALHDGEAPEVAKAIEAHYLPRFAGDTLPQDALGCAVALADKLYLLAGFFGIGEKPTGEKDPYGLRRAALGVIRILVERALPVPLHLLTRAAYDVLPKDIGQAHADVQMFILERMRGYLAERNHSATEIEAVLSRPFIRLDQVPKQLAAVRAFSSLPEAQSLAAANKRIGNILKQAQDIPADYDPAQFRQDEERALADAFDAIHPGYEASIRTGEYADALKSLAALKGPVDAFFDKVLVMDPDEAVRRNRIGFLSKLHASMNRVADLSKLAA
ncbi:MAG: glycine--tRNA ligase subunit beta [Burkholderiales bacterium]